MPTQQFIVPTLFNTFLGIWYYVLMSELNELQTVPLHVFCILARVFYGMCVSFPFTTVIQIVLSRMILWVSILILTLDVLQVVSIIQQFNEYTLTDALSILFSAVFILSDLLFILQLYNHSTDKKIEIVEEVREREEKDNEEGDEIELVMTENYSRSYNNLRNRHKIKF